MALCGVQNIDCKFLVEGDCTHKKVKWDGGEWLCPLYKFGRPIVDLHEEALKKRPLYQIANLIFRDWRPMHYGAIPYVQAMSSLDTLDSTYISDTGRSIVTYFLSNAQTWRGGNARLIKAELRRRLKEHK